MGVHAWLMESLDFVSCMISSRSQGSVSLPLESVAA